MINILLYVSLGLILFGYILYLIFILLGKQKNLFDCSGFDATKDIISEYDSINVIESTGYFTIYNLKRKIIKLSTWCYYGNDLSSICLALLEAGFSYVDNKKNKYLDMIRVVFSNIKILYIFPIIALIINYSTFNVNDSKISIIFILLFIFISYIILIIKEEVLEFIDNNIKKVDGIKDDNKNKIINFIKRLVFCDKLILFGELVIIVRIVFIMFEIR